MKNLKQILVMVVMALMMVVAAKASTNVSGGIYVNTTWTLAGSPYIVVDTTVVFPGVTLTLQPGVVVKFDNNKYIEIRNASIMAIGTMTDSITFTSNAAVPIAGSWTGIWYSTMGGSSIFNYCNLRYANWGLSFFGGPLTIKNSNFTYNFTGLSCQCHGSTDIDSCNFNFNTTGLHSYFESGTINHCNFLHNTTGLSVGNASGLSVVYTCVKNCVIEYNQTGITNSTNTYITNDIIKYNQTGISGLAKIFYCVIDSNTVAGINFSGSGYGRICRNDIKHNGIGINNVGPCKITKNKIDNNNIGLKGIPSDSMYCNSISNNTTYGFQYIASTPASIGSNYWGTADSTATASVIYDGYDNISLGLLNFMPLDTSNCYLDTCSLVVNTFILPASCVTCSTSVVASASNGTPPYSYLWETFPASTYSSSYLPPGTYTLYVSDGSGCNVTKYVHIDTVHCPGLSMTLNSTNATCGGCYDGIAWATPLGGTPPYNYFWGPSVNNDTITGLGWGEWYIWMSDAAGCALYDTVNVYAGNCSANFTLAADTVPHHYIATNLSTSTGTMSYDWSWGDGTHDYTAYPSHTYATAGFYTICLSIQTGPCFNTYCYADSLHMPLSPMVYVNVIAPMPVGISEKDKDETLTIYPNPATLAFTIESKYQVQSIKMYDVLLGKVIKNYELGITNGSSTTNNQYTININQLPSGMYFVEIKTEKGVVRKKIVKE